MCSDMHVLSIARSVHGKKASAGAEARGNQESVSAVSPAERGLVLFHFKVTNYLA